MSKYIQYKNTSFNHRMLLFDIGDTILVSFYQIGFGEKRYFQAILFQHLDDHIYIDKTQNNNGKLHRIDYNSVDEVCHTRTVLTEKYRWRKYFQEKSFIKPGHEEYVKLRTDFTKNYRGNE